MSSTVIQGQDAVLYFYKNTFVPFMCASDVSIELDSDLQDVRTLGDGHWAKKKYNQNSYQLTLGGLLMFDNVDFTGWDLLQNQLGFAEVEFRCTFSDSIGDKKSVQGSVLINKTTIGFSAGQLVRNDFTLVGNGALMFYDGDEPCPSEITGITITGQTSADGTISVAYTYTGAPAQVKYRLNNTGPWVYAGIGAAISIPALAIGAYTIEVVPVCLNGYEGTGASTSFNVTRALTCALAVTSIGTSVVAGTVQVTVNFNADPSTATMRYRLNGGAFVNYVGTLTNPTVFNLSGLSVGAYTIEIIPTCANLVDGTGNTANFTISSTPSNSLINYSFSTIPGGSPSMQVYLNGVLQVNLTASGSGSFSAPIGQTVLVQCGVNASPRDMTLTVTNTTTSTTLYNHSTLIPPAGIPATDGYSFTANGDTFSINVAINP